MKTYKVLSLLALLSINYAVYSQCDGDATFTDTRNSKAYNIMQIDGSNGPYCLGSSQCWFAENLNIGTQKAPSVTHTNDGTIEKYCHGNVDASSTEGDCVAWGGLYQWDEMMAYGTAVSGNGPGPQGVCPSGWHVPTDNEWKCLEMNLGMTQAQADMGPAWRGTTEGNKLKTASKCFGGSDCATSGLEVLFVGYRNINSLFHDSGRNPYMWSATQSGSNIWVRQFGAGQAGIYRNNTWGKTYGFSVRCVRDNAPVPLPVELLYFKASWANNVEKVAILQWETISETNNDHFEVERSINGVDFEFIKKVEGIGNSNINNSYSILDENPYIEGISYYRLKQVDNNGDFEYSNVEALNVPEGLSMINLYPNPTVDQLRVLLTSSEDTESKVSIKNNLGQEVRSFDQKIKKGINDLSYNFSDLETGNYIIEISTSSGIYKVERKFVKTKN